MVKTFYKDGIKHMICPVCNVLRKLKQIQQCDDDRTIFWTKCKCNNNVQSIKVKTFKFKKSPRINYEVLEMIQKQLSSTTECYKFVK